MYILDKKIREKWKNYLWQSAAAGFSLALILLVFTPIVNLVIVAAAGATCFTVFAIPNHVTAQTRNIVGGQGLGIVAGLACSLLPHLALQGGLAVGLATLAMVMLNAEHPPAAGTALGLAIQPTPERAIFIISAAVIFALVRLGLSDYLEDLALR